MSRLVGGGDETMSLVMIVEIGLALVLALALIGLAALALR